MVPDGTVATSRWVDGMTDRLAGKRVLVTGAAQGLGAAIARRFAVEGALVVLSDINEAGVVQAASQINEEAGTPVASAIRHDVTSESGWLDVIGFIEERLHGLSVLVNNAGAVTVATVEQLSLERWRRDMAINADSVFLGIKAALPLLRRSPPASIVNVASISSLIAAHNLASYNASKAAVWMLTKSVALHCAKHRWDVRCNSLHPAFIRTSILNDVLGTNDEDAIGRLAKQVPLGRIGEADDVAHAAVYLASDESRFVTGAELKVDGGISAQ
jgi:NAD(P)-dependent dehydrogenase (short-subunit alcohol dehydrogenase family)